MEFTVDELGDVRAIRITGNLDTKTAPAAQEQLIQLIDNGATKILVDVGYLNYITSSGLRILLVAAKRLEGTDGELDEFLNYLERLLLAEGVSVKTGEHQDGSQRSVHEVSFRCHELGEKQGADLNRRVKRYLHVSGPH